MTLGTIRRIDDLGRLTIPKEIRRQLEIKEGDPIEIYMNEREYCIELYKHQLEGTEIEPMDSEIETTEDDKINYEVKIDNDYNSVAFKLSCTEEQKRTIVRFLQILEAEDAFDLRETVWEIAPENDKRYEI